MKKGMEQLVSRMRCPKCRGNFTLEVKESEECDVIEGSLCCANGHRFGIHAGVADFGSEEQKDGNAWSEYLKSVSYDELNEQIENSKTEKEKLEQRQFLNETVASIKAANPEIMVDIASGRGMLLEELAKELPDDTVIVATDLSFEILVRDRLKFKKLYPNKNIVYLACDATEMPLKDGAADATSSFFGVANMLGIVDKGIAEASRVTKDGGSFYNCFLNIKEESVGYARLKEICEQNELHGEERCFLEDYCLKMHSRHFDKVSINHVVESIYDCTENTLDLLPYPGEWFAYNLFVSESIR